MVAVDCAGGPDPYLRQSARVETASMALSCCPRDSGVTFVLQAAPIHLRAAHDSGLRARASAYGAQIAVADIRPGVEHRLGTYAAQVRAAETENYGRGAAEAEDSGCASDTSLPPLRKTLAPVLVLVENSELDGIAAAAAAAAVAGDMVLSLLAARFRPGAASRQAGQALLPTTRVYHAVPCARRCLSFVVCEAYRPSAVACGVTVPVPVPVGGLSPPLLASCARVSCCTRVEHSRRRPTRGRRGQPFLQKSLTLVCGGGLIKMAVEMVVEMVGEGGDGVLDARGQVMDTWERKSWE
jgi:hypothetical protein